MQEGPGGGYTGLPSAPGGPKQSLSIAAHDDKTGFTRSFGFMGRCGNNLYKTRKGKKKCMEQGLISVPKQMCSHRFFCQRQ